MTDMNETAAEVPVTCDEITDQGLLERYLAGTLGAATAELLEVHLVACQRCQTELRLAAAITGALAEPVLTAFPRRHGLLFAGIGLALAAGLAAILLFRPFGRTGQWRELGAVSVAPIYLGVDVRGTPTHSDSLFAAAMRAYNAQAYKTASTGLEAALAQGADSASTQFFLGASLLMQGKAHEADAAFSRVIAAGDTPYQGEARLYRAKALLQEGRVADAVTELHAVTTASSEVVAWAHALADSVEGRLRR
jgi:anti-sigma factor ChrR (cupin superfamily)